MAADGIHDRHVRARRVWRQPVYDGKTWMLPNPTGGALGIAWYNMKHLADAGFDSFPGDLGRAGGSRYGAAHRRGRLP